MSFPVSIDNFMIYWLVIICIGSMVYGGQGIYEAFTSGAQREMSCDDYIAEHPKNLWVKLTDCEYLVYYGVIKEKRGFDELLLPVWGSKQGEQEQAHVVVTKTDYDLMKKVRELEDAENEEDADAIAKKYEKDFYYQGTIEGMVEIGINNRSSSEKGKVEGLSEAFADDAVYIEEGAKPSYNRSIMAIGIGIASLLGAITLFRRKQKKQSSQGDISNTPGAERHD